MSVVYLALLHVVGGFNIDVEGDVAFDVRVSTAHKGKQQWYRHGWGDGNQGTQELVFKMMQVRDNVTVAPEVECIYQYPENEQFNAMLSNMMNELTKVFVRASDYINGIDTRRVMSRLGNDLKQGNFLVEVLNKGINMGMGDSRKGQSGKAEHKHDPRKVPFETRFRIVDQKQKEFFELIFTNMTDEYRHFYNTTAERVDRSGRDPCQHQDEIKQIWRDLLEYSLATLKKAAHRCVDEYLRDSKVEPKSKIRSRLSQYLMRELSKVRSRQLDMLCDTYQLCYNELLK